MLDLLHLECFSVICNWLVIVELKLLKDNLKMQTAFKKVKLTLSCCFKHASVTNTSSDTAHNKIQGRLFLSLLSRS